MDKIFRAILETENFTFEAYENTRRKALNCLISGCKNHCKQYKVSWNEFKNHYLTYEENWPDSELIKFLLTDNDWPDLVYEIEIGVFYRDKEKI